MNKNQHKDNKTRFIETADTEVMWYKFKLNTFYDKEHIKIVELKEEK